MTKIIYTGVFLEENSKRVAQLLWPSLTGTELLPKEFAHHMTLSFRPKPEVVAALRGSWGASVHLPVIGFAADDKVQALAVDSPKGMYCDNAIPHVTVATDGETAPKYSNELLKRELVALPPKKLILVGRVGWWDGRKVQFSLPEKSA